MFWLHQVQRFAQDLVLNIVLAEQPLQFSRLGAANAGIRMRVLIFSAHPNNRQCSRLKFPA
jgi:hypothetical protein